MKAPDIGHEDLSGALGGCPLLPLILGQSNSFFCFFVIFLLFYFSVIYLFTSSSAISLYLSYIPLIYHNMDTLSCRTYIFFLY